jgi:hypothetical protein
MRIRAVGPVGLTTEYWWRMNCPVTKSVGLAAASLAVVGLLSGCTQPPPPSGTVPPAETYYIGSNACSSCHANFAATHSRTGHAQALKPVVNGPPSYPAGPGVPDSPPGFDFSQISYVVGGYEKAATYVDANGFVLTTGTTGVDTKYNQVIPPTGIVAGFTEYLPEQTTPLPFEFDQFFRRTTGAKSVADNGGLRQDNRPGIEGTWEQTGVQCEACHGPGSRHPSDPLGGTIQLDPNATSCTQCHANTTAPKVIAAADGLINGFQQVTELAASPHTGFACTYCHNPHVSVFYDRGSAIINECQACHPEQNMGLHEGIVFVRGDYSEPVTCVSCHMPYAVQTSSSTDVQLTNGTTAHFGDTRSHIFRLNPSVNSQTGMFTADGTQIAVDAQGRASVSTCYVCQRCHTGLGNAFTFPPNQGCAFGTGIHGN